MACYKVVDEEWLFLAMSVFEAAHISNFGGFFKTQWKQIHVLMCYNRYQNLDEEANFLIEPGS